jgi:hypothetical protein
MPYLLNLKITTINTANTATSSAITVMSNIVNHGGVGLGDGDGLGDGGGLGGGLGDGGGVMLMQFIVNVYVFPAWALTLVGFIWHV